MKRVSIIFVSALAVCGAVRSSNAQTAYFSMGVGGGGAGVASCLNLTLQSQALSISGRLLYTQELQIIGTTSPVPSVSDIALLVGVRSRSGENTSATFEAGVGSVTSVRQGTYLGGDGFLLGNSYYEKVEGSAIGLAFQSQFYHRAFGLVLAGNINDVESFATLLFSFRLGKW